MKIVHITTHPELCGAAKQVVGLIERLQAGSAHHLFCPNGSRLSEIVGNHALAHTTPFTGRWDPRPYFKLTKLLSKEQPDLLHIHSRGGADFWGPMAARKTGTPFIVTRREDALEPSWLIRRKFRQASRVIGISERVCGNLLKMGVAADSVTCVRSGVDTQAYRPQLKSGRLHKALRIEKDALLVGMTAPFIGRTGHEDLLAAATTIIPNHPHTVFILFGDGPLRAHLKKRVGQLGIASCFRFPGCRDDLPRLLPDLDLFVHPTHAEGLGVAILEASACGLPVVATRAGGIPEIVKDRETGLLVPPAQPGALAAAINALLTDPIRRQSMGAAGRDFAVRECSLDATAVGNGTIYLEVLRDPSFE